MVAVFKYNYRHDSISSSRGTDFPPSYNPKKGPSREGTTQNTLTMLPMGRGGSIGSLKEHCEKECVYISLRLQEAVYSPVILFPPF